MIYAITPPARVTVPIRGSEKLFPVHRIYCVGRNYGAHALEMGGDPLREPPFFFQKNPDNLVTGGGDFPYPGHSTDVHHEVELVVALASGGNDLKPGQALEHVFGYGVGIDMTRRDLQGAAKKAGRPWEVGKAFEHSAPCSDLAPAALTGHPATGAIWLEVDGERRQEGDLAQMIWKVPEVIAYLSALFTLAPGDLIFTGTPAGVGPVNRGSVLTGEIEGLARVTTRVT